MTVIATGFEWEGQPAQVPVAAARASRSGQQAMAGQTMGNDRMRSGLSKISTARPSCGGWEMEESRWNEPRRLPTMNGMYPLSFASKPTEPIGPIGGE